MPETTGENTGVIDAEFCNECTIVIIRCWYAFVYEHIIISIQ